MTYFKPKENSYGDHVQTEINSLKQRLITEIITLLNISIVSVLYGYGIRGILSLDWNFLESMGIGLIISHIISRYIPKLYKYIVKLFTKKSI